MFSGMNAAKMQGMMKKMGISQTQLPVNRVIFEMEGENLIINNPSVLKVKIQGQESYQVSGEATLESVEKISEEDIELVVKKTGKNKNEVKAALEKSDGDIAEAIIDLKD